jgi:APA family basic amino acid/polyamine antiporter
MTIVQPLRRILGLGFGLAFAFGTMIGVGILRLPGMVAAAVGTPALIIACWCFGGLYALMGAVSVSELATMYPEAGGFRVYARRAFGERAGFAVGWIDWLACVATLAYGSVAAVEFAGTFWVSVTGHETAASILILCVFAAMHCAGMRLGGTVTSVISAMIGVLLLVLTVGCFVVAPSTQAGAIPGYAGSHGGIVTSGSLLLLVPAIRAVLTAYDGWYAPIYTAEECVDASRQLPRSIIGCTLIVIILYVAINIALLRVLSVAELAASKLPAAAAAKLVLPRGGSELVTAVSILIALSLINSNAIMGPRVLFSMAREGWISPSAAALSRNGTPRLALFATTLTSAAMILTGTFNELIALFAVLILLYYIAAFLAVFVLRRRAPDTPRPYRAFGYPVSTGIALLGSVAFLAAAVIEDWRSGVTALVFLSLCVPAYALAARARSARRVEPARTLT